MYRSIVKRLFDLLVGIIAFLLLLPFFLLIVILLYFANNGKPFFFQTRPGLNGKLFNIIKFRTMNDKRDADGELLSDAKRLTGIGSFVRKTSLDEIPQLLNVIKGEMSLIGPRPLLPAYMPYYSATQLRRHEIRPGITGWAQVNGRNAIGWDEKFIFDVWYVDNVSFFIDIKILILTMKKVFASDGITAVGHATMPTFIDYMKEKNKNNS